MTLKRYRKNFWKNEPFSQFSQDGIMNTSSSGSGRRNLPKKILLPREVSLAAGKSIVKLLVSANSFCSSDLFVLSCRMISSLCCNTQPHIPLYEIIDPVDLNQLILFNISAEFNHGSVSWGSPWSQHAILSLFMDIIDSEKQILSEQNNLNNYRINQGLKTDFDQSKSTGVNSQISGKSQLLPDHLKIIEEHEEPQSIDKILEAASVYDAIKLSSNLAKNFTQISDMLDVHLNDVDKKPFKTGRIFYYILIGTMFGIRIRYGIALQATRYIDHIFEISSPRRKV